MLSLKTQKSFHWCHGDQCWNERGGRLYPVLLVVVVYRGTLAKNEALVFRESRYGYLLLEMAISLSGFIMISLLCFFIETSARFLLSGSLRIANGEVTPQKN